MAATLVAIRGKGLTSIAHHDDTYRRNVEKSGKARLASGVDATSLARWLDDLASNIPARSTT